MTTEDKIFLTSVFAVSLACFYLSFLIRHRTIVARKWFQVKGRIVESTIRSSPTSKGGRVYEPIIMYEFQFEGQRFRSSHWRLGNYTFGGESSAIEVTSRYPAGTLVTVYVNPSNPTMSLLETDNSSLSLVPIGFGLFFFAIFLLGIVVFCLKLHPN